MKQLKMYKMDAVVRPYPLPDGTCIRTLRPTAEADIAAWLEICREGLLGGSADPRWFRETILQRPGVQVEEDVFLVCEKEGETAGRPIATITAFVLPEPFHNGGREGRIHMVSALPEVRGRKIGHAMLAYALEHLARKGVSCVSLTTDDFRRPAIAGYLRAGFYPVLYDTDMEARWRVIYSEMGVPASEQRFFHADGTPAEDEGTIES